MVETYTIRSNDGKNANIVVTLNVIDGDHFILIENGYDKVAIPVSELQVNDIKPYFERFS